MPAATRQDLFALLDRLGIAHRTTEHPPVFTVEEARQHTGHLPGGHCKNLFLKDKKDALWLLSCLDDAAVRLSALDKVLGAKRLSFARPELLREILGVEPGSVTPFALIADTDRRVTPVFDTTMLAKDELNFHPLHNAATTTIAGADLLRFVKGLGYTPSLVDLAKVGEG